MKERNVEVVVPTDTTISINQLTQILEQLGHPSPKESTLSFSTHVSNNLEASLSSCTSKFECFDY